MKKLHKRGQTVNQVFIFLISAMIFSMVVIYGYRAVTSIGESQEKAILSEFRDTLMNRVEQIALDYGSVKRVAVSLPTNYREVCFLDNKAIREMEPETGARKELEDNYPIIYDSVISGVKQNVYLLPLSDVPIVLENIEIPESFFCLENKGGSIVLRLEGLGDRVSITPWPDE